MRTEGKRCLVIGANSFIGMHLIAKLKQFNEVTGVYNNNTSNLRNDIKNVHIDKIRDIGSDFELVYLVGAYIPRYPIDDFQRKKLYDGNVELVSNTCSIFNKSKIIFCSSVSVYSLKEGSINEFDSIGGINEYGVSKLWSEKVIQQNSRYSILRFSSVYGKGMQQNSIIPTYINQCLNNGIIKVFGQGERLQNYIHVDDAINFLDAAGDSEDKGTYLCVSNESISNSQLALFIANKLNSTVVYEGTDNSPSFIYNNNYTEQNLKYKCNVPWQQGIETMI